MQMFNHVMKDNYTFGSKKWVFEGKVEMSRNKKVIFCFYHNFEALARFHKWLSENEGIGNK